MVLVLIGWTELTRHLTLHVTSHLLIDLQWLFGATAIKNGLQMISDHISDL